MKITFIIDRVTSDAAGTENQLMKLVRGLSARGHDVELLTFNGTTWLTGLLAEPQTFKVAAFELGGVGQVSFWTGLRAITAHLKARRPDVVHTFFPGANIFGVLAAHRAGVRAIVSSRRDYGHWITPRYLKATRFANRRISGVITNSQQVKELTTRVEGVPAERIRVIANGIDVASMHRPGPDIDLRRRIGLPDDAIVVGLVANFRPIKRHDTLIDACKLLLARRPNLHLLFIGGDNKAEPARDQVRDYVARQGLSDRVHYTQAYGNIADFLSILDIGVNCSESEGLSNAIVEYMCARVPCVISDGGGNRDLVEDGRTGLLFPVGDAPRLAQALDRMLADAPLRERCREAALAMVRERMDLNSVLEQFETAYCSFLYDRPNGDGPVAHASALAGMRSAVKAGVVRTLSRSGPARMARRLLPTPCAAVMMYHEIGPDDQDCDVWQVVRREDFLRQVEALRARFDLVPLDVAHARMASGQPTERPMAVLTFDDGNAGNLEHLLPAAEAEAVPITIFIATGHIEAGRGYWFDRIVNGLQGPSPIELDLTVFGLGHHRINHVRGAENWARIQQLLQSVKSLPAYRCEDVADHIERQLKRQTRPVLAPLTPAQVGELSRSANVTLGSHTHGHEVMTMLDDAQARRSIQQSQDWLTRWTGRPGRHFAFPGGFHDGRVEAIVRELGFATAMGGAQGLWTSQHDVHAIPRLFVGRYDSLERFCFQLDWSAVLAHRQSSGSRALEWLAALGLSSYTGLRDLS